MSAGPFHHYFDSKEEIPYSIINSATSKQAGSMEDYASELGTASPTRALTELMRKSNEWHDANQDVTLFTYQETRNLPSDARQGVFDSEARILTAFEKLLTRGVNEAEFSIDDHKLIAHDVGVLGHAWALRRWCLRRHSSLQVYIGEQTNAVLRTIRVDNTGVGD